MEKIIEDKARKYAAINDDKAANLAMSYSKYHIAYAFQNGAEFGYELAENKLKQEVDILKTKSNPKYNAFAVYPDSVKMGLSSKNTLIAIFRIEQHAQNFGYKMWKEFYIVKPIYCDTLDNE